MDTVVKALNATAFKSVRIQDAGNCIAIAFDDNIVLLNKAQVSIVEVIKGDTVRVEMGGNTSSTIFLKYSDISAPVVANAGELRDLLWAMLGKVSGGNGGDGDCACAPLIEATNTELRNVTAAVQEGNGKLDVHAQTATGIYNNGVSLNQIVTDHAAANAQGLNNVLNETVKVSTNTAQSNNKLDVIAQSSAASSANILATNQVLADNHAATLQTLAGLKTELMNVRTTVSAGNDQLSVLNQGNGSIINNGTNGNQYLASLDNKFGNNGFLGNVSRKLKTITVQPVIGTTAYAAGQVIGGVMTLTGALRAAILSGSWMGVQVVEKSTQKAPMDIVLFTQNPTAANFTDHVAPTWTNDYGNIIGITNIVAANYSTLSTSSGVCLGNLCKRVLSTSGGNLYAVAICNGTPTYASASHLYFTFYFEQD